MRIKEAMKGKREEGRWWWLKRKKGGRD